MKLIFVSRLCQWLSVFGAGVWLGSTFANKFDWLYVDRIAVLIIVMSSFFGWIYMEAIARRMQGGKNESCR